MRKRMSVVLATAMMAMMLTACSESSSTSEDINTVNAEQTEESKSETTEIEITDAETAKVEEASGDESDESAEDSNDMFTKRDMEQTADMSEAEIISVEDGKDISITEEGVYVISGASKDTTIYVEAGDEDKVQIVLDGVSITNASTPCIYVKSADKVFVTTTDSENSLAVTGTFEADGDTNLDAVIFSKEDLVVNGIGALSIDSTDNAITSKDTLKVTGGTLDIKCSGSGLEAHDAIEIADGTVNITGCTDGLHAEDSDDDSIGSIYISGGTFNINASDDAIHATTTITISGGEYTLVGAECLEGTFIQINDGTIDVTASDDGINAAYKSSQFTPTFEMNGGTVTISMGAGDTDGVDSNGDIYINGGTINITGQSSFDYDGTAEHNGGTIIVNGEETDEITNQMMGGPGGQGGFGPGGQDFGGGFGGQGPH